MMFSNEMELDENFDKKVELAKKALNSSRKVRDFYEGQYYITVDTVGNDPTFLDGIIMDGIQNNVFTEDEIHRVLYPEKHQVKKYDVQGYECAEMIIDLLGNIKWIENPHTKMIRGHRSGEWRNSEFPVDWAGQRFKLIRISDEPSK